MAESKVEQLARTTELKLALVEKDVEAIHADLDAINLNQLRERLSVVEDRVTELRKAREEADRRHWQMVLLFFGGLITLGLNLVLLFLRSGASPGGKGP